MKDGTRLQAVAAQLPPFGPRCCCQLGWSSSRVLELQRRIEIWAFEVALLPLHHSLSLTSCVTALSFSGSLRTATSQVLAGRLKQSACNSVSRTLLAGVVTQSARGFIHPPRQ